MAEEWYIRAAIVLAASAISGLATWFLTDHRRIGDNEKVVAVEQARFESLSAQIAATSASVNRLEHRLLGNNGSGAPGIVTEVATLALEVKHLSSAVAELKESIRDLKTREL